MAYDIQGIVDPKEVDLIVKLGKATAESTESLIAFIEQQKKLKTVSDEIGQSTDDAQKKVNEYAKLLNKAAEDQNKLTATAKALENQQKLLTQTEAKLLVVNTEANKKLVEKQIALKKANEQIKESITGEKAAAEAAKQKAKADKEASKAAAEAAKAEAAKNKPTKEAIEIAKLNTIINNKDAGTIEKLTAQNKLLTIEKKKLNLETKEGVERLKEINKQQDINNKLLKDTNNEEQNRIAGIGQYKQTIIGLGQAFLKGEIGVKGLIGGVRSLGKAIFSVPIIGWVAGAIAAFAGVSVALIKNSQEFQKAASSLRAITGASDEQMSMMKKAARDFSKETGIMAADILGAFEKVGSALPDLLKAPELLTKVTRDAITLSQATGGKLSVEDAAKAAAAALNQFGLPLTESARAINVLAAGSKEGSAEVADLTESFKNVGSVAAGAGLSLEQTVAALETLGEKSLYGTEAGTKLRGVILKLQDAGLGYASGVFNYRDALVEANAQLNAQESALKKDALAQKFFGAENITAGKILLANIEKYDKLTVAVTGTNTAFEQANIQNDNLTASYSKIKTAWSGLLLSVEDGGGWLAKSWKWIVDDITKTLNNLSAVIDFFKSKESKQRKKDLQEQKQAEQDKRAELLATAEQLGITVDEKMKNAEIEAAIAKKLAENQKKLDEEAAKAKAEVDEKEKKRREKILEDTIDQQQKVAERLEKIKLDQLKFDQEAAKDELDIQKALDAELFDEINNSTKQNEAATAAASDYILAEAERRYNQEVILIQANSKIKEKEALKLKGIARENALDKIKEEEALRLNDLDKKITTDAIYALQSQLENFKGTEEEKYKIKAELEKAKQDLDNVTADAEQAIREKSIEDEKKAAEKKKAIRQSIVDATTQIATAGFDFVDSLNQAELTSLEQKKEQGLITEKDYAKQKAEIELKQAKLSKTKGVFEATISTAQAIIGMLKDPGGLAGTILAVAAGVTGALQVASILSQPLPTIPAFKYGSENTPSIFRAAEDNKREILTLRTGEKFIVNEDTLFAGDKFKGAKVMSNTKTEQYLSSKERRENSNYTDTRLLAKLGDVERAIKNKDTFIFQNKPVGRTRNGYSETYLNRLRD